MRFDSKCFAAGTQILVRGQDGEFVSRNIEDVQVGDWVWSRDYKAGEGLDLFILLPTRQSLDIHQLPNPNLALRQRLGQRILGGLSDFGAAFDSDQFGLAHGLEVLQTFVGHLRGALAAQQQ